MEWTRKKILMTILFVAILILSVVVMYFVIVDETFLFRIIREYFILPLLRIGPWAAIVFLFLMVMQSLIAPIPSELILLSGAMIFGFLWGTVLGVIGSILSGTITYYVSKQGGRTLLEAAGEKMSMAQRMIVIMDEWIEKWGIWAIIVGRAVPVIMFDPVSYAAGISNIKAKPYTIATAIGSIPRALFFSFLGMNLLGGHNPSYIAQLSQAEITSASSQFNTIFFVIFGVLVAMLVFANILSYMRERAKNKEIETQPKDEENNPHLLVENYRKTNQTKEEIK
ncbi:MAG: TVP38/TMEM64 family protein [Candidatus Lokiarchaeota archaeon]|nr:TVP38/TMEM64 family protein [Candidatus Harpocratesius repetitus]